MHGAAHVLLGSPATTRKTHTIYANLHFERPDRALNEGTSGNTRNEDAMSRCTLPRLEGDVPSPVRGQARATGYDTCNAAREETDPLSGTSM